MRNGLKCRGSYHDGPVGLPQRLEGCMRRQVFRFVLFCGRRRGNHLTLDLHCTPTEYNNFMNANHYGEINSLNIFQKQYCKFSYRRVGTLVLDGNIYKGKAYVHTQEFTEVNSLTVEAAQRGS